MNADVLKRLMKTSQLITHTLPPIYDARSRVLILGTMPSPKSREVGFYYGNPQNRFWRVMAEITGTRLCVDNAERTSFLIAHRIALWDVLASCEIHGADDGSIRRAVPNDLGMILQTAEIQAIFTTGKKAGALYQKLCFPSLRVPAVVLPSTSPANCRNICYEEICTVYRQILDYL